MVEGMNYIILPLSNEERYLNTNKEVRYPSSFGDCSIGLWYNFNWKKFFQFE